MNDKQISQPAQSESMLQNKDVAQFVSFQLNDQEYAFRIERIQEIIILDHVTSVPQVASYVEGVSNLRGTIIPILSLRKLFGLDPKPIDNETRTIVVNVGTRTMGCTVDSVSKVMRIPQENIQAVPDLVAPDGTAYVSGFAKIESRLIILLDIDELLDPEKLEQVHQAAKLGAALPEVTNDNTSSS